MSFLMPDLKTLSQKARNAFKAEMPGVDAWVWPSNIYVTAKVFAGIVYELFLRLRWIDKQRFAQTATLEGLLLMGEEYGLPMNGATYAQGFVEVPCVYPYVVPVGTVFTRASDDVAYVTTKEVSAIQYSSSTTISAPVVCQTIGKVGNCLAGASLDATLAGLTDSAATVTVGDAGIGQGADAEDVESYRQRILFRKRNPPMGGSEADYEAWAKQVSGVTRVFVKGNAYGPGTVGVWFLMDGTYTGGIPQASDVRNVYNHLTSVAPVTAILIVQAPVVSYVDVTVKGVYPDTNANRQAVAAELLAVFQHMVEPGLPDSDFTLYHSWLAQAVNNAMGVKFNEGVTSPAKDVTFTSGVMPILRSVTFE